MIVTHQHPFKIVSQQSACQPSFWVVTRIPPAPMKVSASTHLVDDFGDLVSLDMLAFAIHLNTDNFWEVRV